MTEKILIVDDEQAVLEGLRAILKRGFNIITAHGPKAGLLALRAAGPFAVVVSDFKMPQMDGAEFLSRVREISPRTVRVVLSGYADFDAAVDAMNKGECFRFLTKPCDAEVLRKTLLECLERFRAQLQHLPLAAIGQANLTFAEGEDEGADKGADNLAETNIALLLSPKELRVADLLRLDASSKEIARVMNISTRTVESHRNRIRKKLRLGDRKISLQNFLKLYGGG